MSQQAKRIQDDVTTALAASQPDVEVLLCELAGSVVRVYIDHPAGVTLALCESVTRDLSDLLINYSLEVSSPGADRPLSKPQHFRRFLGRRARVRTRSEHDGRKTFIGELIDAGDKQVIVASDGSLVSLSYDDIDRSNLVPDAVQLPQKPKNKKRPKGAK